MRLKRLGTVSVLFIALLVVPAVGSARQRIIGGTAAPPEASPWMAALLYPGDEPMADHFCGGALIHPDWVVTAAHCAMDDLGKLLSPEEMQVAFDLYDLDRDKGERFGVRRIIVHPEYNLILDDSDIALIELERPSDKEPLPLYDGREPLEGRDGIVMGWGWVRPDGGSSNILREVAVPVVSNDTCNAAYNADPEYHDSITGNMLCAGFGEGGKDACSGDSGGPFVVWDDGAWKLAGVVSWGHGCAEPGFFGVYTRVSNFIDFIGEYVPESPSAEKIYFPVLTRAHGIGTRIGLANMGGREIAGTLRLYGRTGEEIPWDRPSLNLPAYATEEIDLADATVDVPNFFYAVFESDSRQVSGYVRIHPEAGFETSFPAVPLWEMVEPISLPVILSNPAWWTAVGFTNTTRRPKTVVLRFDTDETVDIPLAPGGLRLLTIRGLFGAAMPDLGSAEIEGGGGIIAMGFHGGGEEAGKHLCCAVPLNAGTTKSALFLSFTEDPRYWSGMLLRNATAQPNGLTFHAFGPGGYRIATERMMLSPMESYIAHMENLGLPGETSWVQVLSEFPLEGFQLFGVRGGREISVVPAGADDQELRTASPGNGSFLWKRGDGWKAMAFTNPFDAPAEICLSAYDRHGGPVGDRTILLGPRGRWVGRVDGTFGIGGRDVTQVRYSSDLEIRGVRVGGGMDGSTVDALAGFQGGDDCPPSIVAISATP